MVGVIGFVFLFFAVGALPVGLKNMTLELMEKNYEAYISKAKANDEDDDYFCNTYLGTSECSFYWICYKKGNACKMDMCIAYVNDLTECAQHAGCHVSEISMTVQGQSVKIMDWCTAVGHTVNYCDFITARKESFETALAAGGMTMAQYCSQLGCGSPSSFTYANEEWATCKGGASGPSLPPINPTIEAQCNSHSSTACGGDANCQVLDGECVSDPCYGTVETSADCLLDCKSGSVTYTDGEEGVFCYADGHDVCAYIGEDAEKCTQGSSPGAAFVLHAPTLVLLMASLLAFLL